MCAINAYSKVLLFFFFRNEEAEKKNERFKRHICFNGSRCKRRHTENTNKCTQYRGA